MAKTTVKNVADAKQAAKVEAAKVLIAYADMQHKQIQDLLGNNWYKRIKMFFVTKKQKQAILLVRAAEFVAMHGAGGNAAQKEKKARKAK